MNLKERKCPNCGGHEIFEKDGEYICGNCHTLFDDHNNITITKTEIIRDEAKLAQLEYEKKKDRNGTIWCLGIIFACGLILWLIWQKLTG